MQLTLGDSDFEQMPTALKRDLFRHLAMLLAKPGGTAASARHAPLGDLGRPQSQSMALVLDHHLALDLIREVSFDERGEILHALLERFAEAGEIDSVAIPALIKALGLRDDRQFRAHLGSLTRLVERLTGDPEARLFRVRREPRAYVVHAETRRVLNEVMRELARSGEHEEPLWE